jgi:hypothetical protein
LKYALLLLASALLLAQTPLEFGIIDDLIRGEPYISPLSIKVDQGSPAAGNATLRMALRAGVVFSDEGSFIFVDSLADQVNLMGRADYRGLLDNASITRIFTVVRSNMRVHGTSGITHFAIDLVTPDDMGWVAMETDIARVDSLLGGMLSPYAFWNKVRITRVQVGMGDFPLNVGIFDATQVPDIAVSQVVETPSSTGSHAWKSLVLPGWGQYSSGTGLPLINILAEAGGIALMLSDDYLNVGVGVLAINHIISFTDLL